MSTEVTTVPLNLKKYSFKFRGIESIPSKPRIPLKNYLLDLVAKSDGKESSVYLKGVEKFIQEIWREMVQGNWRKLQVTIPETLEIYPQFLCL